MIPATATEKRKRYHIPESTAFISLSVASGDINGLIKNCANLRLDGTSISEIPHKENKVKIKKAIGGTYLKHHAGYHCSHQNRSLCVQKK